MADLPGLWLPILVSSIVVFFASFVSWMLLPFHKKDWQPLPDERGVFDALARLKVGPGQYMFPHCADPSAMRDPEVKKRWEAGPHGTLCITGKVPNFGRNLLLVFLFYVLVGIFVAYIGAGANLTERMDVARVTGTAAILAYAFAVIPNAIFFGKRLGSLALDVADGVVYGLLTGLVFAMMWDLPEVPALPL